MRHDSVNQALPATPRALTPSTWPQPTGRCFALLGIAALLLALDAWVALGAAAMVLLAFALDARAGAGLDQVEINVQAPERLSLGADATLQLELHSRVDRDLSLELALDARAELLPGLVPEDAADDRAGAETWRVRLRAGSSLPMDIPLRARTRGRFRIEALDLRITAPAGLAAVPARAALGVEIEVVPGWHEAREQRLRAAFARQRGGQHLQRRRGAGTVFESLAEYTQGDDPRHLDWKATARRRTPVVRRYETERRQNVVVVCDTGRWMAERIEGGDAVFPRERLDAALGAACALGQVAHEWGDHLGLMLFDERVQVLELPGPRVWRGLPSRLAEVRSHSVESDYARALVELTRRVRRRSLIVLISDVLGPEVSGPLSASFAALGKRHLPLFVALSDPRLDAAARAEVKTPRELHRRAAALELLHDRAKTLESMRRSGIDVLDVGQASATTALIDRYLELKRGGRL